MLPNGSIDELQRFAKSSALISGKRDRVVLALILHVFTAPHLTADLDHLASSTNRRVVPNTVKSFDDLRAGRTQPQGEPAIRHIVEPGRGHRGQRGRSGVELQNSRSQLHVFGVGGQIAQRAHRVEGIRLGDKDNVQPGAF